MSAAVATAPVGLPRLCLGKRFLALWGSPTVPLRLHSPRWFHWRPLVHLFSAGFGKKHSIHIGILQRRAVLWLHFYKSLCILLGRTRFRQELYVLFENGDSLTLRDLRSPCDRNLNLDLQAAPLSGKHWPLFMRIFKGNLHLLLHYY